MFVTQKEKFGSLLLLFFLATFLAAKTGMAPSDRVVSPAAGWVRSWFPEAISF